MGMRVPGLVPRVFLGLLLVSGTAGRPTTAGGGESTYAVCFAPGTPQAEVARVYRHLPRRASGPGPAFQFPDTGRWQETATDGCCLGQGDPTTLTWSVVPDLTPIDPQIPGESSSGSSLRGFLDVLYGSESVWQPILQEVFDRWGELTGVTYVYEPNDDGDPISPFSGQGILGVRGDVRLSGHSIDGDFGILAYNYFPNNGDMVLDAGDSFFTDTSNNSLRLRNTVSHEHGHGLGIEHVCPVNQTKLMEPFASTAFDGPQHDDTLAGNRGYGDDREDNDTSGTATNLGSPANGTTTVTDVSADDGSAESDFYRFTIPGARTLSVTVTPIGFTYQEAAQNPNDGSCFPSSSFNSLILDNLGVSVLASNGSTVLATANSAPAGVAEAISNLALPAGGNYFVKVFAQSGNNNVQLYQVDLTLANAAAADLSIGKTDGQGSAVPGNPISYTITAANAGPQAALGALVVDTVPAFLTGASWTCSATPGSSCPAGGSGSINTPVNLVPGGSAQFVLQATVSPTAAGTLSNTASIAAAPGVPDPNAANNSATDVDVLAPQANLAVSNTDGQASAVPGLPIAYSIVVTSTGPSSVVATVLDTPTDLTGVSWTCNASAGSSCTPLGSSTIFDHVTLAAGGVLTYTLTGTINPSATGTLSNTASVTPDPGATDPNPANNTATDTDTLTPQADLAMANTDSQATAVPGSPVTYHLTVSNTGPSHAPGATVSDAVPAPLLGATWTCSATSGSSCPASGSGSIGHSVNLSAGGSLSYLLTGTLVSSATGSLVNTAAVTAPGGVPDPASGNNSATDTDTLTPQADLRITKTDGQPQATPGGAVSYTIVASNPGPSDAPGSGVADAFPGSVTGVIWSCTPSGGGSCGAASGSGDIAETAGLPSGGVVTYLATGTIAAGATGTLVNTATVAVPGTVTELEPSDNGASDVDNLTLTNLSELVHGSLGTRSLESQPGPVETRDYYWVTQAPRSSFEVVVDGATGSISSGSGPDLELLAADASTVVQPSVPAGAVSAKSLRFENPSAAARSDELVRVQSAGCTTACGPEAVYRIRAWETTYRAARFNNSGSQITVLVVQNETASVVTGHIWLHRAAGTLVASQAITLQPRAVLTLNTSGVAPSASGSITISHDGPYGALTGKAVAVEPATGFTFDTPLVPRPR